MTDNKMIRETRWQIANAPLCEPSEDQYVDACQWSRTGYAVYEADGRCTCQPTLAFKPKTTLASG